MPHWCVLSVDLFVCECKMKFGVYLIFNLCVILITLLWLSTGHLHNIVLHFKLVYKCVHVYRGDMITKVRVPQMPSIYSVFSFGCFKLALSI